MDLFYGKFLVNPTNPSPFRSQKPLRFYIILWSFSISLLLLTLGYSNPLGFLGVEGLALDAGTLLFVFVIFLLSVKFMLQFAFDFVNSPVLVNETTDENGNTIPYDEFRLHAI